MFDGEANLVKLFTKFFSVKSCREFGFKTYWFHSPYYVVMMFLYPRTNYWIFLALWPRCYKVNEYVTLMWYVVWRYDASLVVLITLDEMKNLYIWWLSFGFLVSFPFKGFLKLIALIMEMVILCWLFWWHSLIVSRFNLPFPKSDQIDCGQGCGVVIAFSLEESHQ